MGPRRGSKKDSRKIDATELEDTIKDAAHSALRGPAVETLTDQALFFEDKAADVDGAKAVASGRKRKERSKELQLRSTVIITQDRAPPVVKENKPARKIGVSIKKAGAAEQPKRAPKFSAIPTAELDIWGDGQPSTSREDLLDLPKVSRPVSKPRLKRLPVKVKAVEVDLAGCSYNPDKEEHQDALAELVAAEMKRQLRRELAPIAPQKLVTVHDAEELDELRRLQVEETPEDADVDENEIQLGSEDADDEEGPARGHREKKTKKDRNREKRRLSLEKELEQRRLAKKQRRDLEQLSQIQAQLREQLELQESKRQRRQVVLQDKAETLPPKLGKMKFEPAGLQVATTDELGGSLRTVKPCAMVALDRFKSLQHRGLIEPRKPINARAGKKILYEKGLRTEKALQAQAELDDFKRQRKQATKQLKAKKAKGGKGADA